MRLALHIFKKDIRRLWWETLVATGALAYLAHMDSNRMDYMPGPMEGLMNIVVPAAWAYLIAMLVHQEPLVGDRQFWLTRPYPRGLLLAAKLLFVLCFIHVPSFVFDIAVVQARGFNPLAHLPALLLKQAMLAAALCVPALALAAVTKNLAQFASVGLICAVAGYFLAPHLSAPWVRMDTLRQNGAILVVCAAACVAITLQYSRRRVLIARFIAIGMFAVTVLVAAYLPSRYTTAAACRGGPTLAIVLSEHNHPSIDRFRYPGQGTATIALPISVPDIPVRAIPRFGSLTFEISNQHGGRWSMPSAPLRPGTRTPERPPVYSFVYVPEGERIGWLLLTIDQKLVAALTAEPMRLTGTFAVRPNRIGEVRDARIETYGIDMPRVGRCANFIVENLFSMYRNDMLKAVCESPDEVPQARVELVHVPTGRRVRQALGDASMHVGYPIRTWLSPVNRRNTFFHITESPLQGTGDRWLVMRTEIPDSKLEFASIIDSGCSVVRVDFPNIDLRKYILR